MRRRKFITSQWFLVILFLMSNRESATAQNASWKANLSTIARDGFYKIPLSPEQFAKTGNKLNRIRILEAGEEVPFIVKRNALAIQSSKFNELPFIESSQKDSVGTLIFENTNKLPLGDLIILMKRAWVTKKLNISGSNDREHWFVVRSKFLLNTLTAGVQDDETSVRYSLDLPVTDYKYFQIQSDNKDDLSINILSIGYFTSSVKERNLVALSDPIVEKLATNNPKIDIFKLTFNDSYLIDRLIFKISRPHFFQRNARLYTENPLLTKGSGQLSDKLYASVILSSRDSVPSITLDDVSGKMLFLLVENQDSPSLHLETVNAFQNQYFIYTYLEKNKNYEFLVGADSLVTPDYDLSSFAGQIAEDIPVVTVGKFVREGVAVEIQKTSFFKTKMWIWIGLIFVAAILAYMSAQMVKEMKK